MTKQNIISRIAAGTISTNFSIFPEVVNGFTRDPLMVADDVSRVEINAHGYSRGNEMGYVTAADLSAGLLQVRKVATEKVDGARAVAIPSDEVF